MMPWSVPPAIANSALVVAALSLFGLLIRQIGPWRMQINDLEERLRRELMTERQRCEAELKLERHRNRGNRQLIYSLLHLFDMPAAQRKAMLANIKDDLARIEQSEATESGLVASAAFNPDDMAP